MFILRSWIIFSCVPLNFREVMQAFVHRGFGIGCCIFLFTSELPSLSSLFSGCDERFSPKSSTLFCTTTLIMVVSMDCITYRFWTVISSQPLGEGHVSLTSVTVILVCWVYGHPLIPCCGASIILRWAIAFPFQVLFFVMLLMQDVFWIINTSYKIVLCKSHFASHGFGFVQHLFFLCQITVCPIQSNYAWFCTKHVPHGYGSQIPQSGITCVQQQLLLIAFCRIVDSSLANGNSQKCSSRAHVPWPLS